MRIAQMETFASVSFGGGYLITAAGYRNLFLFGLAAAATGGVVMYSASAGRGIHASVV